MLHGQGAGQSRMTGAAAELFDGIRERGGQRWCVTGGAGRGGADRRADDGVSTFPPAARRRRSLRDGLAQTIAAIDEEKPVLVVLDDAHAADEASRRLLVALAPRLTGGVMMLLAADEGERRATSRLRRCCAARGLRQLRLTELSAADVEAMLESMVTLDSADRHPLAVRLHAETGGLPHDVRELVTSLVDDHLLTLDAGGAWRPSPALAGRPLPMPPAVQASACALASIDCRTARARWRAPWRCSVRLPTRPWRKRSPDIPPDDGSRVRRARDAPPDSRDVAQPAGTVRVHRRRPCGRRAAARDEARDPARASGAGAERAGSGDDG